MYMARSEVGVDCSGYGEQNGRLIASNSHFDLNIAQACQRLDRVEISAAVRLQSWVSVEGKQRRQSKSTPQVIVIESSTLYRPITHRTRQRKSNFTTEIQQQRQHSPEFAPRSL
jgi:hypothetical protein